MVSKIINSACKREVSLSSDSMRQLKDIANDDPFLLVVLLTSFYSLYIKRLTGKKEIRMFLPTLREERTDFVVSNLFIPLKIHVDYHLTYKEFLLYLREEMINCYNNFKVVDIKDQNIPGQDELDDVKYVISMENLHNPLNREDFYEREILLFNCRTDSFAMTGELIYYGSLYFDFAFHDFDSDLNTLIQSILTDKNIKLEAIDFMDSERLAKILFMLAGPEYMLDEDIIKKLQQQVRAFPDKTAIMIGDNKYTYLDLWERINSISNMLLPKYRDQIIGVYGSYDINMIAAIFGILKSGNAYLPLDSSIPEKRFEKILEITGCSIIIGHPQNIPEQVLDRIEVLPFTGTNHQFCQEVEILPDSLAYVIFTSGTTGEPKAIPIQHRSLYNFIVWKSLAYEIDETCISLQLLSFLFDAFATNLYPPLLNGGTCVLVDQEKKGDFKYIAKLIKEHRITDLNVVPNYYVQLLNHSEVDELETVKLVVLGGERTRPEVVEQSLKQYSHIHLVNEYGPSENTVTTTYKKGMTGDNCSIIGKPIINHQLFIVNEENQVVPLGVPGELCIGGIGLTPGYLGSHPDRHFITFYNGTRVYKTGDFVRANADGEIEYLGRLDNQISLNGYRIDLEEIESTIINADIVGDCIVAVKMDKFSNLFLCAYLLSDRTNASIDEINLILQNYLPDYMIPKQYVRVESFPITTNGKKDRKVIVTDQRYNHSYLSNVFVEAVTDRERIISNIWKEVLQLDKISVIENFFNIGGNSLLIMELHRLINDRFPDRVTIPDMYTHYTIRNMAMLVDKGDSVEERSEYRIIPSATLLTDCFLPEDETSECSLLSLRISREFIEKNRLGMVNPTDVIRNLFAQSVWKFSLGSIYVIMRIKTDRENVFVYKYAGEDGNKAKAGAIADWVSHHDEKIPISSYSEDFLEGICSCLVPFTIETEEPDGIQTSKEDFFIKLSMNENKTDYDLILETDCDRLKDYILESILMEINDSLQS